MDTLHLALKTSTAEQHARLDELMANGLADVAAYTRYLQAMAELLEMLGQAPIDEESRNHWATWFDGERIACLRADLGLLKASPAVAAAAVLPPSGWMGANYVLEGSALGARVLLRDANALRERDGRVPVSFLQHHAGRGDRWPRFLSALAALEGRMRDGAERGAQHAFALVAHALKSENDE